MEKDVDNEVTDQKSKNSKKILSTIQPRPYEIQTSAKTPNDIDKTIQTPDSDAETLVTDRKPKKSKDKDRTDKYGHNGATRAHDGNEKRKSDAASLPDTADGASSKKSRKNGHPEAERKEKKHKKSKKKHKHKHRNGSESKD
jgi:hypothetical protein